MFHTNLQMYTFSLLTTEFMQKTSFWLTMWASVSVSCLTVYVVCLTDSRDDSFDRPLIFMSCFRFSFHHIGLKCSDWLEHWQVIVAQLHRCLWSELKVRALVLKRNVDKFHLNKPFVYSCCRSRIKNVNLYQKVSPVCSWKNMRILQILQVIIKYLSLFHQLNVSMGKKIIAH